MYFDFDEISMLPFSGSIGAEFQIDNYRICGINYLFITV